MNAVAFGNNNLLRNSPANIRRQFKEELIYRYKTVHGREPSTSTFILIIESIENNNWKCESLFVDRNYRIAQLSQRYSQNSMYSLNFTTAKKKCLVNPSRTLGEVYEDYHDPDDQMLYLCLLRDNPF